MGILSGGMQPFVGPGTGPMTVHSPFVSCRTYALRPEQGQEFILPSHGRPPQPTAHRQHPENCNLHTGEGRGTQIGWVRAPSSQDIHQALWCCQPRAGLATVMPSPKMLLALWTWPSTLPTPLMEAEGADRTKLPLTPSWPSCHPGQGQRGEGQVGLVVPEHRGASSWESIVGGRKMAGSGTTCELKI